MAPLPCGSRTVPWPVWTAAATACTPHHGASAFQNHFFEAMRIFASMSLRFSRVALAAETQRLREIRRQQPYAGQQTAAGPADAYAGGAGPAGPAAGGAEGGSGGYG